MHACPHCQQPAFNDVQKLLQLWWRPRFCPLCHKAAFLPVKHVIVALIVWTALSWVFIGVAFYMHNAIFLLGSVPAGLFAADLCMRKPPLQGFDHHR